MLPFAFWNPGVFFGFAPLGINSTKLGSQAINQIGWPILTASASLALGFSVQSPRQLYTSFAVVLSIVTLATWLSFARDLSYLQLPFLPLLFTLPRTDRIGSLEGEEHRLSRGLPTLGIWKH